MRAALAALPGARHITVDFENQQATVTFGPSAYDEQKLIGALEEAGFGGSVQKTKAVADKQGTESSPSPKLAPDDGM